MRKIVDGPFKIVVLKPGRNRLGRRALHASHSLHRIIDGAQAELLPVAVGAGERLSTVERRSWYAIQHIPDFWRYRDRRGMELIIIGCSLLPGSARYRIDKLSEVSFRSECSINPGSNSVRRIGTPGIEFAPELWEAADRACWQAFRLNREDPRPYPATCLADRVLAIASHIDLA